MRSVATGRTPVPSCSPEGSCVCCEDWAPGWRRVWYSRSSNTARERLKPLVLTLARLLEITSICVCCASRPVFDIQRERIIIHPFLSGAQIEDLAGLALVVFDILQELHLHVVLAGELDHVDHFLHHVDVARLQRSRHQHDIAAGLRRRAIFEAE